VGQFISHIRSNAHFYRLFLVFVFAELLVNPLGEFPLIDDWSFAQTVKIFSDNWKLDFGNYPAMTLFSQIVWGTAFTKVFGFSCVTLRISTLISLWISLYLLYQLLLQFGLKKSLSVFVVCILLFNPMVFLLGNTFMTDVNFNSLLILGIYALYNYLNTNKFGYYLLFVVASVALILLRQYGLILPVAYLAGSILIRKDRIKNLVLASIGVGAAIVVLKLYESHLKHLLPEGSEYKFSGEVNVLNKGFWEKLLHTFNLRIGEILLQALVISSPVFLMFLFSLLRAFKWTWITLSVTLSAGITWFLFYVQDETSNCIFSNTIIGPETFYESFNGARHNVGTAFDGIYFYIKILLVFFSVFALLLGTLKLLRTRSFGKSNLFSFFLIFLLGFYAFMILITESYFDRYHIPMLTILLLLLPYLLHSSTEPNYKFSLVFVCFFGFVSIAGTKDYFEWNRKRWEAYWYLRNEKQVEAKKINGGLEVNCWREGHGTGWGDFLNLKDFDYLVQFNPEPGFSLYKSYEFKRYFPYKNDKINIFVSDSLNKKYD
jgi:4-amino-4-deoxy-L-arabinose transferase-like glycosyltransferase